MKELMTLVGFGTGMVVGVMLYKYSKNFQKSVDKGEMKVMESAKELEQKAEEKMDNAERKIKQGMKKIEKKAKKIKNEVKL